MPPRNMKPLPGKMPNGQDKDEYTQKCHELVRKEYKSLLRTALYHTGGDSIWAKELLHETLLLLLEGYHNVDFNKAPVQYVRILMRHVKGRHKQIKQKDFNRTSLVAYDPQSYVIESHIDEEERQTDLQYLVEHFKQLQVHLKPKQKMILELYLDGNSCPKIGVMLGVSSQRVNQILLQVKKDIRKEGLVLLRGGSVGDRAP